MVKRSISIASPGHLHIENRQLILSKDKLVFQTAPLEDLSIIVVDTPETTWTSSLLSECGEYGILIVFCGSKHLPSSVLIPHNGHHLSSYIQRKQLEAKLPTKKRLWQSIITAKISAQSSLLRTFGKNDIQVRALLPKIKSGDATNVEGVAAARYFVSLFGDDFTRDPDLEGINSRLNYGYAILRACVARSIVLSGLDPGVGIWHHNRFNHFPLADDLMEPLRPLVDSIVLQSLYEHPIESHPDLTPPVKRFLLKLLTAEVIWNDPGQKSGRFPIDTALQRYVAQVRDCLTDGGFEIQCPKI